MNYWERRQQELNSALEKDEAKLKKRLSSFYDTEYRKLEKEIAAYYSIYGENKVIEYRNLMQNLSDEDKEQMIKRMQDFVQLYPEYADLLPVRESIYKLNRLEGLQMSVRIQQYEMGAIDNEEIRRHLMRQAVRSANVAAETMGYGKNFYSEDSNIIKTVVNTKWSNGKDFSERIWGNVEKLAQYLNTDIAAGFARGDSYERMTRQLRQRFGKVSRNDAYRLIYTEGTFVMNEARAAAFEADTEEYIFRVQYDKARRNGWRDICDDLNEEIFKWSERKPGINFPPMHPWCHCTATPHIANRQKWLDDYEKRHRNGQAEKVANRLDSGIIESGGTRGALTDKNDPLYEKRDKHAETYYESVRNSKKEPIIKTISRNSGFSEAYISKVYNHVFINEYELYGGTKRFEPDYDMAESFRRLREGKDIQEHDIILLKHEHLEYGLMNKLGISYDDAHDLAQRKYDYTTALNEFKEKNDL